MAAGGDLGRAWRPEPRLIDAVLAVLAVAAALVVMRDGVGVDADSAVYLGAAEHIAAGDGITVPFSLFTDEYSPRDAAAFDGRFPLTHYPPAYPLSVALVTLAGLDVESAARLLGAVVLGINVMLIGSLARRCIANPVVRALTVVLAAVGPVAAEALPREPDRTWLFQHSQAMSEGPFTTFVLLTLVGLWRYRSRPTAGIAAAVALGSAGALAVRYSGLAVVVVAAGGVAVWSSGNRGQRALRGVAVGLAAVLPVAYWYAITVVTSDARPARAWHWPNRGPSELAAVFEGWLGLANRGPLFGHVVLAAVVVTVVIAVGRTRSPFLALLATTVATFTVVVVGTRAAFDASTPTDARMFAPVQGIFYVLVIGAVGAVSSPLIGRAGMLAPVLPAVGIGVPLGLVLSAMPSAWRLLGDGVAERGPALATVVAAASLPDDALVATNAPAQLWEAARRRSVLVPLRISTATDTPNPRFDDEVGELAALICERDGYLVLIGSAGGFGVSRQATVDDFAEHAALEIHRRFDDGVILRHRRDVPCATARR